MISRRYSDGLKILISTFILLQAIIYIQPKVLLGRLAYHGPDHDLSENITLKELFSLNPATDGNNIYLLHALNSRINGRALCAAESWCLHHPTRKVWFTLTSKVAKDGDKLLQELLKHYQNLDFAYLNLTTLFLNSSYQNLISSNNWKKSYPDVNLSDLARSALLWRTGGLYVDTDVVAVKNTNSLRNVVGLQNRNQLNGAVIHFDKTTPYLKALMDHTAKNYKPSNWGWNGPIAMTATGEKLCGKDFLKPLENGSYRKCHGLNILPTQAFYPIHWREHKKYMENGTGKNIKKFLKDTYAIHVWNKISRDSTTKFGSDSIYDVVARSNCPVVYKWMQLRSDHF